MRTSRRNLAVRLILATALCGWLESNCFGHPVPRRSHDRTIVVELRPSSAGAAPLVLVKYRLEVDEFTVVFDDLPALGDRVNLSELRKPDEFHDAFTRGYAPILAGNLLATLNGEALEFRCTGRKHTLIDENGVPLNHLRCDFVFEAAGRVPQALACTLPSWPGSAGPLGSVGILVPGCQRFGFREGNYEFEEGRIRLSLAADKPLIVWKRVEPDADLLAKTPTQLVPGDDRRLRNLAAVFSNAAATSIPESAASATSDPKASRIEEPADVAPAESAPPRGRGLLRDLLLETDRGFVVLLLLAAVFGAAHALTPGHGKTLVAAYLVGERGTVGHALILGLVTTLTHTGAVLALAALLPLLFPRAVPENVQAVLGFVGGFLVAAMGFWLLLQRLGGGADHIHLGGGHHHHDHSHGGHGHGMSMGEEGSTVRWWSLIVLGVSGGIVPCWDAIIMLGLAISAQRLWLGLPLLLAFSGGLAAVLIGIGICVVYMKGFTSSRWGSGRIVKALPLVSAVLVTGIGLWLCFESLHPPTSP